MGTRIIALGCTILFVVACGDDGSTASGEDAFCAGAERMAAVLEEIDALVAGRPVEDGQGETSVATALRDVYREATEAIEEMIDGAEGDLRRDLGGYLESLQAVDEAIADVDSPIELMAVLADVGSPPPGAAERGQRINDAAEERCGVALVPEGGFTGRAEAEAAAPWGDVDVCSSLPAEALADAGFAGTEGVGDDDDRDPRVESCVWGDLPGPSVSVELWNPVSRQEFADLYDEQGEIAGRTAYFHDRDQGPFCDVAVDNVDYFVTVEVSFYRAPQRDAEPCDTAERLAASALSSLPS